MARIGRKTLREVAARASPAGRWFTIVTTAKEKRPEPVGLPFEKDIQILETMLTDLEAKQAESGLDLSTEIEGMRAKVREKRVEVFKDISPLGSGLGGTPPEPPRWLRSTSSTASMISSSYTGTKSTGTTRP